MRWLPDRATQIAQVVPTLRDLLILDAAFRSRIERTQQRTLSAASTTPALIDSWMTR
jgi:hypothetical protein